MPFFSSFSAVQLDSSLYFCHTHPLLHTILYCSFILSVYHRIMCLTVTVLVISGVFLFNAWSSLDSRSSTMSSIEPVTMSWYLKVPTVLINVLELSAFYDLPLYRLWLLGHNYVNCHMITQYRTWSAWHDFDATICFCKH